MFDVCLHDARRWHSGPNRLKTSKMAFGESIAKPPYPAMNIDSKLFISLNDGQKKQDRHRKKASERERERIKNKIKQIFIQIVNNLFLLC